MPERPAATREPPGRTSVPAAGAPSGAWDSAPRYLVRDRDASHGAAFRFAVAGHGYHRGVERPPLTLAEPLFRGVIGSTRRESLNHVIVLSEHHLRRLSSSYLRYYHHSRTHLS